MKEALDYHDYIVADPHMCGGVPRIKGTRIPVSVVLANLAEGLSPEEIIKI